jgi:hypothetical protein
MCLMQYVPWVSYAGPDLAPSQLATQDCLDGGLFLLICCPGSHFTETTTPNHIAVDLYISPWELCKMPDQIGGVLRSYSKGIGSKGLWPQLVCCAPFLSIAPYFRILYLSYPKIRMAIVAYAKVWTTIVWYPDVVTSIIFLSEDKE